MVIYGILLFTLLIEDGEPTTEVGNFPGATWSLPGIAPATDQVLSAVAVEQAEVVRRHAAHISTQSGGIGGGGMVHYAKCQQQFEVREVVIGQGEKGRRTLTYEFVEKTTAFPGPKTEQAVPQKLPVLVLVSQEGRAYKILVDTPKNRQAVSAALKTAKPKYRAEDVELLAAWVLGQDTKGAFDHEFSDAKWLIDSQDVIVYTDVSGATFPEGMKAVPYDFIQARLEAIRQGRKAAPAVVITGSVLADPAEEGERAQKYDRLKPSERCYHVEVGIGNMAWHVIKITIRDVNGKPRAKIHRSKIS